MHAINRLVKLRMDLLMGSWDKSLQIDYREAYSAEMFLRRGWVTNGDQAQHTDTVV